MIRRTQRPVRENLRTEELQINMGPQHPSTHGVLRVILQLDGEWVVGCDPDMGYLHRSFEKLGELKTYVNGLPLTDRWDYLSAMSNNLVWCQTVEKLMGLQVPERGQYLRVMVCELNRIASHLVYFGTYGLDLGAQTPFLYCFRDRELILDLFEMICGARLTYSFLRIGGLAGDAPPTWLEKVQDFVRYLPGPLEELEDLLQNNAIFVQRTRGVGVISSDQAIAYGLTGPMLRASGVAYDVRKQYPYQVYDRLQFDIPLGRNGDCWDRCWVRLQEMRQALRIVQQCLDQIPEGEFQAKVPKSIRPPAGDAYSAVESPRGELGLHLVSDGSERPYRAKIRRPSFINLSILPEVVRGGKIADLVAILGTTDIVMGEVDG